jgi:tRNA-binding protein
MGPPHRDSFRRDEGAAVAGNDGDESVPLPTISYDDFRKVDIRVGTIVAAEAFPEARRPAYKLKVDFGDSIGIRRTSVQIVPNYKFEELVGRQVAAVVNFPPKQIGPFMSEVLVLGFPDGAGEVVMIAPDKPVPNGGRLY